VNVGIKESDFDSFERSLSIGNYEDEVTQGVRRVLDQSFDDLGLGMNSFCDLLTDEMMDTVLTRANYLFSQNRISDPRGVDGGGSHLVFLEGGKVLVCYDANDKMEHHLRVHLPAGHVLQDILNRDDDHQMITVIRLSPHYASTNFY
jgi:hypothetical protein